LHADLQAIEDGLYEPAMKDRLKALQAEQAALDAEVVDTDGPDLDVLAHPSTTLADYG
jgi:hypothetical protein